MTGNIYAEIHERDNSHRRRLYIFMILLQLFQCFVSSEASKYLIFVESFDSNRAAKRAAHIEESGWVGWMTQLTLLDIPNAFSRAHYHTKALKRDLAELFTYHFTEDY